MFSVIIPLYNKETSIAKTLASVLNQTYPYFEIIVVNDGSTDLSQKVVEDFTDIRIRLINKKNGGVSSARNLGIISSSNDWIAFIDADDIWEPNYLEEMYSFIKEFPEAQMFGCAFDNIEGDRHSARNFYLPKNFKGIIHNYFIHAKMNLLFWPTSTIVSKSALVSVCGFDERISMGEDIDIWIRLAYKFNIAFYNKILAHYVLDGPNRAMKRQHDFKNNYLYYTDKFKDWEFERRDFKIFINYNRLVHLVEVFKNYSHDSVSVLRFLKSIDYENQNLKYRIFNKLPYFLKRILIRLV